MVINSSSQSEPCGKFNCLCAKVFLGQWCTYMFQNSQAAAFEIIYGNVYLGGTVFSILTNSVIDQ